MEMWQTAMEFSCAIIECDQLSVIPKLYSGTCLTLNMLDNFHNAKVNVCNKLSYHVIKLKCCHLAASLYEHVSVSAFTFKVSATCSCTSQKSTLPLLNYCHNNSVIQGFPLS